MIKKHGYLIAIDLDGTLIQGFDNYNKDCFDLIREIAKTNYVVIATGRPYRSSKYFYDLLELKTPIINYNGALVHNPNDSNFKKTTISVPKSDIAKIIEDNIDKLENIFSEIEDEIFLWKKQDEVNSYLHADGGNLHIGDLRNILPDDPNGAIVFSKLGTGDDLEKYINTIYKDKLKIRFWDDKEYIISEIYNPLTSKANGLKQVIDYYNIDPKMTIAIGDGHNDIEMFNVCEISVAMANSHKDLIKHATHKTMSVKDNGVYYFLKDFFTK